VRDRGRSTFVAGFGDSQLPWFAYVPLVLALVAFAGAAASGIMAGRPMEYKVGGVDAMTRMVFDRWGDERTLPCGRWPTSASG
jgi:hypothetical protein